MQFLNYIVSLIICYLGIVAGMILLKIAPEEKKQLNKTFHSIMFLSLALIFIFCAFYFIKTKELLIILGYAAFVFIVQFKFKDEIKRLMIIYAVLGVIFNLSARNTNLFLIESSLVFIYGTAIGSIHCKERKILFYNSIFIIISILLFTTSHSLS